MFPILARRRHAHAGALSGGEQKQVQIARTLLLNLHLIMLDEPSIGLDPKSRKLVFEASGTLAASGRTAGELLADPDVARLYLGGTPQSPSEARRQGTADDRTRDYASAGRPATRQAGHRSQPWSVLPVTGGGPAEGPGPACSISPKPGAARPPWSRHPADG